MRARSCLAVVSLAVGQVLALAMVTPANATFTGSNGRISFFRFVEATNGVEIFSANAQGVDVQQLTWSGDDHNSVFSDWSPDGSTIAFDSDRTDSVQVYTMNWDGSNTQQLTAGDAFFGDPAYSRDGNSLAIESDWGDYPALEGIWIIPSTGSGITQAQATRVTTIPQGVGGDSEPQWSPDSQWIAFTRYIGCKQHQHGKLIFAPNGCTQSIYRVHPDGSGLQRLTPPGMAASAPDFSPDGTRITFDSCDSGKPGCTGDIYVMNADGSNRIRLVKGSPVSANGRDIRFPLTNNPVWSPDGTKILFARWLGDGSTAEFDTVS